MIHIPDNSVKEEGFVAPDEDEVDQPGIRHFEDGSVLVGEEDEHAPHRHGSKRHFENLARVLGEGELRLIGNSLKTLIEEDIKSQENFYEGVAKAIEYLGLTLTSESDKEDLPFKGASSVYSSALFESALDLVASAKGAIFPTTGMVDSVILGEADEHLQDVALRKKEFFNYYFDTVAKDFRKEAIRTIFWAVLAGSAYKKVYICPVVGRPVSHFIPIEDFIVNREHSSHMAASRKTHILRINQRELQIRKMTGIYRETNVMKQDDRLDDDHVIREQLDQISGYESSNSHLDDSGYVIYECHVEYNIKGDPKRGNYQIPLPYIISIDAKSGNVLAIIRNWEEGDFLKTHKEYFVNYSLLPSLDGEGYGLVNYAGRMAEAATSLTRQLINAGTYANFPGGVYAAGIRLENNNLRPAPGEFVPIQTGGIPVGQAIESLPYKEPSATLGDLKNQLEDNIKKPSAIVNQEITDMAPRAPMGSVLAMLENLQKVPNAILQNFHESFSHELELFNDRFGEWLKHDQPYPFIVPGGRHVIMKKDFDADIKVIPSSDPSSNNSTRRFMLSEIVMNNAANAPDVHNMEEVYKYFYKNLGLGQDDIDRLLSPKEQEPVAPPQPMDPVSTIMAITQGQPVTAGVEQDHKSYISILDAWIQDHQQDPNMGAATALKAQHEAMKYMVDVYAKMGMQPPQDPTQIPMDQQNQLAVAVAQIKEKEAQEARDAQGPPPEPPMDPARVMLEDSHLKAQMAHEKNELDGKKLELEAQKMQMDFSLKEQEFNLKSQIQHLKQAMDEQEFSLKTQVQELKHLLDQQKQEIAEQKIQIDLAKLQDEQAAKGHDQMMKERDQQLREHSSLNDQLAQQQQQQGQVIL